jgi:transcriptional regulator with XRE-family HTH domain
MKLPERIRQIRLIQNLTQEEVAERCGIAAFSNGQIERKVSTSSFETLEKQVLDLQKEGAIYKDLLRK